MAKLTFGWGMFRQLFDWSDPDDVQIKAVYLKNASDAVVTVDAAVTAHAGGGQGSATAITKDYTNISTCATAGDSVKLPTAAVGKTYTITNRGAASADVFPYTGDTINGGSANAAIALPVGATIQFVAINTTDWKANNVTQAAGDGTVSLPSVTFASDPDSGLYKVAANVVGIATNGVASAKFSLAQQIVGAGAVYDLGTTQNSTPTAAQLLTGVLTQTSSTGAGTVTLPTGTNMDAAISGVTAGDNFTFFFANLGGGQTLTLTGAIGFTVVGTATIASGTNIVVRAIRTGTNTWVAYTNK